jgi:malate synthase
MPTRRCDDRARVVSFDRNPVLQWRIEFGPVERVVALDAPPIAGGRRVVMAKATRAKGGGRKRAAPARKTQKRARSAAKPKRSRSAAAKSTAKAAAKPGAKSRARAPKRSGKPAAKPSARPSTSAPSRPAASPPRKPASRPTGSARISGGATGRAGAAPTPSGPIGRVLRRATRTVKRAARTLLGAAAPLPKPSRTTAPAGVAITGRMGPHYADVLTAEALAFLAELHRKFEPRRQELLAARKARQLRYDAGELPDFLPETQALREGAWTIGPIPSDLLDRRVEITGPVDRKMIVNALNSGANVFMADFEDANSPTWSNNINGQLNLKARWEGTIQFVDGHSGKEYRVGDKPAVLVVRPRGWHLPERHLTVDGEPISGSLFDFGLYFFHNARATLAHGSGPYFYLPKLETHLEARLWNDVFIHAQQRLGLPNGTIKATVLIETLPAGFQMDEILWELRDHIVGLNAGRWDYIFSFIKTFAKNPDFVLPDRRQVVMGKAFLGAYAALLVKTCHRRGAFAMGGMAAQIPVRHDKTANERAFALVTADKEREVRDGHDGTWVAHPGLVPVAKTVFDKLPGPNQLDRAREDVAVTRDDLLRIHEGTKTEEGFRLNIRVGIHYIDAWLRGRGAVPIYNLMEDAATAEISRAQIWQWIKYGAVLDTGVKATPDFFRRALQEEMQQVRREVGERHYERGRFPDAIALFEQLSLADEFEDFLTLPAYERLG